MKVRIIALEPRVDDYGVYRGADLLYRGTLDKCLTYRAEYA